MSQLLWCANLQIYDKKILPSAHLIKVGGTVSPLAPNKPNQIGAVLSTATATHLPNILN